MRDIQRIPKVLAVLERIWKANPDFRLGQLIMVGARPGSHCPKVFNIEDEDLLAGLLIFESNEVDRTMMEEILSEVEKYPNIARIPVEELTVEKMEQLIEAIRIEGKKMVITPIRLMQLNGAPVADNHWLLSQKNRRRKIANLLKDLSERGILETRIGTQGFKGLEEIGYNISEK